MSERVKGATSVSLLFRLIDSTTFHPKTGVTITTLSLQYFRPGVAPSTVAPLVLLSPNAHTTAWQALGGIEVDATNSPGAYRVDVPNGAFASGADEVEITITGTGVEPCTRLIDLTAFDARNAASGGLTNLDAQVSTRSTFAGGAVASVTAPVTVGTNNDKGGYLLGSAGLDTIVIETGVNARQALSPILAATAGVVSGAGTGSIVIKGGNVGTTRIAATTDNAGNRSAVTLTLPS